MYISSSEYFGLEYSSVVECQTGDQEVAGSALTGVAG